MAAHGYAIQLEKAAQSILDNTNVRSFAENWNLGRELLNEAPVRAFYARTEGSYANLAILTDKLVIDIEENEDDESPGGVGIAVIRSIGTVYFRSGPIITIPGSETSQLTVVTMMTGAAEANPYWVAKTGKEREDLTRFGKALLNAVVAS